MPDNIFLKAATWLVPLVAAIVLHEVSHGWVANALGDPTAKRKRRLSLNPLRHVDPVGTVILPLVLAVTGAPIFGWAKPVPVVARRLRNPRLHMMIVALAGPGMNLLLALLAALALGALNALGQGGGQGFAAEFLITNLANFLVINVFLAVFNLLPIPPFDGGHVIEGLLPRPLARRYARLGRFGFLLLILLLVVLPMVAPHADLVARIVDPPVAWIIGALAALAGLGT
jgi:Zn-dependent protease